jgi:bromodomain-containing protein 7/9
VPANVEEAYSKTVPNPIDFGKIRSRVLNEEYNTLGAFISDARLLCRNALAYNPPGTIYDYCKTAK